jgi:hypothetical protein
LSQGTPGKDASGYQSEVLFACNQVKKCGSVSKVLTDDEAKNHPRSGAWVDAKLSRG